MGKRRSRNRGGSNGQNNNTNQQSATATQTEAGKESQAQSGGNGESADSDSGAPTKNNSDKPRSITNDPEWYAKEPQMVLTTCNLPFSEPLGSEVKLFGRNKGFVVNGNTYQSATNTKFYGVPGIASFRLHSSIGKTNELYDAANVAANALYTHIRVVNSGRKNYDAADLMMYVLAISELYSIMEWCKRIYGYAFLYSQRNWYIAKELLKANSVDPSDVVHNLANFNTWINAMCSKISMYAVPNSVNYFKRKIFSYSTFYLENNEGNIKDQVYQFVPGGFYKFDLDANGVGSLVWTTWRKPNTGTLATVADIETYVEGLLNTVYGDEDFGIMSGDILKAYGAEIMGLSLIGSDYAVMPVYDPDVLYQMQNADILGDHTTTDTYTDSDGNSRVFGNIYQLNSGIVEARYVRKFEDSGWADGRILTAMIDGDRPRFINSDHPMPDPLEVMESSRLIVPCVDENYIHVGTAYYREVSPAADFVEELYLTTFYYEGYTEVQYSSISTISSKVFSAPSAVTSINNQFKYTPRLFSVGFTTDTHLFTDTHCISDMNNYATVDNSKVVQMHEVAMLSLFWVPGVARMVNFNS